MPLQARIEQLIRDFATRRTAAAPTALSVQAPSCWAVDVAFTLAGCGDFRLRNLREGDVPALLAFGRQLGPAALDFFAPYPWHAENELPKAFAATIASAVNRVDASYLLECDGKPIGHFFLWKAGGNPHARAHGVEVPELGVAVADAVQGKGFGGLAMRFLLAVAHDLHADGVELTTAQTNESGWQTYLHTGFEYTGLICNPLDVDVAAFVNGEVVATRFRDERQMIYIINTEKRTAILRYLEVKRQEAEAMRTPGAE